jgi:hypothetical protein
VSRIVEIERTRFSQQARSEVALRRRGAHDLGPHQASGLAGGGRSAQHVETSLTRYISRGICQCGLTGARSADEDQQAPVTVRGAFQAAVELAQFATSSDQ